MAQLTQSRIFNALVGLFSATDATDQDLIKTSMWRKQIKARVHDAATAGTAYTETFAWRNDTGGSVKVISGYAVTPIAVTAHGTNYATFLAYQRTSAGASQATIATFATDTVTTDDMVAHAPKAMTLTDANVVVPAGSVITVAVTKAASGVALTAATSDAYIVLVVEPVGT